jgi:putative transposase
VQLKQEHPSWGAPKIQDRLRRKHSEVHCPAISTVHAILDRHGLVKRRRRRVYKPEGTALSRPYLPNDLWCADYKGEFQLADRRYCYPLTITDFATRYLIGCEALANTQASFAFTVFERVFKDFGLPRAIRTDNGAPFASANSLFGLTRLSVWWLRLGINIERIKPGHPQQNGRHERMHLTLKQEATKPAAKNFLQQQARFDEFLSIFNEQRPHQGLNMKYPAELYSASPRPYTGLPELDYPFHDRTITVTRCGRICMGKLKINLSQAFAGQNVGVKQIEDRIWLVSFMQYDLGFFDHETCRIESAVNPFAAKVSPMSPAVGVKVVVA